MDASNEHLYSVVPGMEHKYEDTALLLVSRVLWQLLQVLLQEEALLDGERGSYNDVGPGIEYIESTER